MGKHQPVTRHDSNSSCAHCVCACRSAVEDRILEEERAPSCEVDFLGALYLRALGLHLLLVRVADEGLVLHLDSTILAAAAGGPVG